MKPNNRVVILSGGFSEEKEVSQITAEEIRKALQILGYETILMDPVDYRSYNELMIEIKKLQPYIVFIGLHGAEGEDGRLQSLLELNGIKFTGSPHGSCAIAMDKHISALLASKLGMNTPRKFIISDPGMNEDEIIAGMELPFVIKPNNSGSSVGITLVTEAKSLRIALHDAFKYSNKVLCEEFIEGTELTVTILGDQALTPVEISPKNGWYDYKNKYTTGNTEYIIPARISSKLRDEIKKQSYEIYELLGCKAYARVDFRYDGDQLYFLEVNTLPGMTPLSLTPMAAAHHGIEFPQLLEEIIRLSLN